MTDERRELIQRIANDAAARYKTLLTRLANDIPHYEIHVIKRCVMCNQDAATNKQGFCPRCARENP